MRRANKAANDSQYFTDKRYLYSQDLDHDCREPLKSTGNILLAGITIFFFMFIVGYTLVNWALPV